MISQLKTNTSFGFKLGSEIKTDFYEWDDELLMGSIQHFGQKSVESSLKFSETND